MKENDVEEEFESIADAAENIANVASGKEKRNISFLLDVSLKITVEVGRAKMTIQDLLQLGQGSVIELEKLAGEPLDIYLNGKQVARGEAVIVNEKFGVRLTDIISPEDRVDSIS
jgi:flagellar motor switch protein FliN